MISSIDIADSIDSSSSFDQYLSAFRSLYMRSGIQAVNYSQTILLIAESPLSAIDQTPSLPMIVMMMIKSNFMIKLYNI